MADDREQERNGRRGGAPRPVTAAARRERRAAARTAGNDAGSTVTGPAAGAADRADRVGTGGGPTAAPKPRAKAKTPSAQGQPAGKVASKATRPGETERKGRPTPARDRTEQRAPAPARLVRFLREVVAELRKVIWPTRKQMITYFSVVLVFLVVMVALVFGLDVLFSKGAFWVFG